MLSHPPTITWPTAQVFIEFEEPPPINPYAQLPFVTLFSPPAIVDQQPLAVFEPLTG